MLYPGGEKDKFRVLQAAACFRYCTLCIGGGTSANFVVHKNITPENKKRATFQRNCLSLAKQRQHREQTQLNIHNSMP